MRMTFWMMLATTCTLTLSATAATEVKTEPVRPTAKTVLFNGKDFSGWTKVIKAEPGSSVDKTWQVADGVIRCTGAPMGYIVTQQAFTDYKLTVEYRWYDRAKNMNSGVFIHKTGSDAAPLPCAIESQLHMGDAGDFVLLNKASVNGIKNDNIGNVKKMHDSSEKPFGEWNRVEVVVKGRTIDIYVNGVHQNHGENATADAGQICLQSEGGPIEFRNVFIEPLPHE
ncbi:MAG: DUF1080 domain-containing protein [Kiritimatiellae bacterium]|nr:DUF1080 domain-containing protein [Kiritimatiellia bacterium]